jgi:hypothetical protein
MGYHIVEVISTHLMIDYFYDKMDTQARLNIVRDVSILTRKKNSAFRRITFVVTAFENRNAIKHHSSPQSLGQQC